MIGFGEQMIIKPNYHKLNKTNNNNTRYLSEILCYADDILIVHLGNNFKMLQQHIDNINKQLKLMKLTISLDKSCFMRIKMNKLTAANISPSCWPDFFELTLANEQPILQVNKISILGMPLNDDLTLETTDKSLEEKIYSNARTLKMLKQLKIVKGAKVWQILFEGYIQSLVIDKNLPILALSEKSRKWADEAMIKVARFVFNWPSTTSVKLIRLFLNMKTCQQLIEKFFIGKLTSSCSITLKGSYKLMQKIFQHGVDFYDAGKFANMVQIQPNNPKTMPIYSMPQALFRPQENLSCLSVDDLNATLEGYWILLELVDMAILIEFCNDNQTGNEIIYNYAFFQHVSNRQNNCFFHSLAALKEFANNLGNNVKQTRQILMSHKSSIYQALSNCLNHDWRIVLLRNALCMKKCKILALKHDNYVKVKKRLVKLMQQQQQTVQQAANNLKKCKWPDVVDYINRFDLNIDLEAMFKAQVLETSHTGLTRSINLDTNHWQNISPATIGSLDLLALAGMIQVNEQLMYGKLELGQLFECCNLKVTSTTQQYISLHKLFECGKVSDLLEEKIDSFKLTVQNTSRAAVAAATINQQQVVINNIDEISQMKSLFKYSLMHKKLKYLALNLLRCASNLNGKKDSICIAIENAAYNDLNQDDNVVINHHIDLASRNETANDDVKKKL